MIEMRAILHHSKYAEINAQLYVPVVDGLTKKLEDFVLLMIDQSKKQKLNDAQTVAVIHNAFHLANDLVPRVNVAIEKLFGRKTHEVEEFHAKLLRFFNAQKEMYIQQTGNSAALESLKFSH